MGKKEKMVPSVVSGLIIILTILMFNFCGKKDQPSKKSIPAKINKAVKETQLTSVILSAKAEERLGITLAKVEQKQMAATLKLGGVMMALPGNQVTVTSPVAGTILIPRKSKPIYAGQKVTRGQAILHFLILPPERELMGAQEEVKVKKEQLHVIQARVKRARQLLKSRAISEKKYQETLLELTQATAAWKAAKGRLNLLTGKNLREASEDLSTLILESPVDGVLQRIYAASGQTVPGATPLFEVAKLNPLWVRVAVYSGNLSEINLKQPVSVKPLGRKTEKLQVRAKPVRGPLLSDATSASADLYYEIDNKTGIFRIGEMVDVTLFLRNENTGLIIPHSAILYDVHGGVWVYKKIAEHTFSRQRIQVSHFVEDVAVLSRGLKIGDEVVCHGAAEIFGTEFGVGK